MKTRKGQALRSTAAPGSAGEPTASAIFAQLQEGRLFRTLLIMAAGAGLFAAFLQLYYLSDLAEDPVAASASAAGVACTGVIIALTAAFRAILELRHRDALERSRGRMLIPADARSKASPRLRRHLFASFQLAVLVLAGAMALIVGMEVVAAAILPPEEESAALSSGEFALREARQRAGMEASQQQGASADGNNTGGAGEQAMPQGLVGPGPRRSQANEEEVGTSIGNLLSDEPLLHVHARRGSMPPSLHLRGLVLDSYDRTGTLQERPAGRGITLAAEDDGWTIVSDADEGLGEQAIELQIEFLGPTNGVVYAPNRLRAVRTRRLLHAPSSELYLVQNRAAAAYGVRSVLPETSLSGLRRAASAGSLGDSRAAPPGGPSQVSLPAAARNSRRFYSLATLRKYASTVAADAPTDFDRVLRVVSHIRETFGYELYDTSFLTPERCEELIQRGSGSCSHFASLSCILLRSLGIPTRIAVGYVTREPLPEGEGPGWLVRARDGHAWIEVHFDGFGWLAFDPTPGDPTAGGATTGWAPLDEKELSALTSNSPQRRRRARTSSLGDWVLQGFVAAWEKLRELGNGAPGGPATGAGRAGLVVGLGLAALGGWLALGRLRRRRGTGLAASPDDGGSPGRAPRQAAGGRHRTSLPDSTAVQGLMGALTSQGLQQRRKETPSAFARRAVHQDHRAEGLLGVLTALIGRATLSRPLKQEDVESVGELTRRLSSTDKDGPGASNVKKP